MSAAANAFTKKVIRELQVRFRAEPNGNGGRWIGVCPCCRDTTEPSLGIGTKPDGSPDLICWTCEAAEAEVLEALGMEQPAEPAPIKWTSPMHIGGATLAELPPELFPPFLRAWIEATATAYQVPAELPASMALSAFSTAVGGRWRVRVAADWYEELSVWMATVLPSGERKSPVVREAKAPIEDHERALALAASDRVAEAQAAHEVLLKRFEKAKGDAAKATGEADRYAAEEQVSTLAVQVRRSRPPAFPRRLADDATPEALTSLLADHGGVMSVLSAEGGLIDTLAGRYSDGVANLDAVLKAHGGEQIRVDRKGRPPELVERPVLTLGLAVQPTVIEQACENRVLERRGFLARFLYLVPTTGLGHRELDPPPVHDSVREEYARRLLRLLEAPTESTQTLPAPSEPSSVGSVGGVRVKELALSAEARGALWIMRRDVERRLDPTTGDLFCVSAWANKLPGAVVRIGGLLHLAEHGPEGADRPISEAQMARAALIGGTLIEHAKAALGHGGPGGVPVEKLRALLTWIERQANDRFSERDAFRGAGDNVRYPDMASFRPALAALAGLGYIRRLEQPARLDTSGRPPSPEYAINPLIACTS